MPTNGKIEAASFSLPGGGASPLPPTSCEEDAMAFAAIDLELDRRISESNLGANEIAALLLMHLQCDYRTLSWSGSADKLAAIAKLTYPQARRALEILEREGFIKRDKILGRKGNYPITLLAKSCRNLVKIASTMCMTSSDDMAMINQVPSSTSEVVEKLSSDDMSMIRQSVDDCSTYTYTSTSTLKPLSRAKRRRKTERVPDPRHHATRKLIEAAYRAANGTDCPWSASSAGALATFLKAVPTWDLPTIAQCIENRFASEVNTAESPTAWIASLPRYQGSPIDRFGKPTPKRAAPVKSPSMAKRQKSMEEFLALDESMVNEYLKQADELASVAEDRLRLGADSATYLSYRRMMAMKIWMQEKGAA